MFTGPNAVNDGLIFYYDTGNFQKSFKGIPGKNLFTNPFFGDYSGISGFSVYETDTHVEYIPNIGKREVMSVTMRNDKTSNCCPSPIKFGYDVPISGGTTYTYGILVKSSTNYSTGNFMHRYENPISGGAVASGGVFGSNIIELGNGWKFSYATFTSHVDAVKLNGALYIYEDDILSTTSVAGAMLVEGDYVITPKHLLRYGQELTSTDGLFDLAGNSSIDISNAGFTDGRITYDGATNYSIINNNFVGNATELTVSAWFKKTGPGHTYECAVHKGSATSVGSSDYWIGVDLNDYLNATIGANSGVGHAAGLTGEVIVYDKFYHMTASWDGSVVRVYINGEFNKQYNLASFSNLTTPTRIGASGDGNNYQFNGEVPVVKIYNRSLSSDEVKRDYRATKSRFSL
jgi:hypothetical protein